MSNMLKIYFEVDKDANIDSVRQELEESLQPIEGIEDSEVEIPDQRITGLEIAGAIGAIIVVAESAGKLIDTTTDILKKLTELVNSIKGLKDAMIETDEGPKRLVDLTPAEIGNLVE